MPLERSSDGSHHLPKVTQLPGEQGSDPSTELSHAGRAKLIDMSVENLVFGDSWTLEHF